MTGFYNNTYGFFTDSKWDEIADKTKIKVAFVISFIEGVKSRAYSSLNRGYFEKFELGYVACRIGISNKKAEKIFNALVEAGSIEQIDNNVYKISHYEKYQVNIKNYQNFNKNNSENITFDKEDHRKKLANERVKKFREKNKCNAVTQDVTLCNDDCNAHVTDNVTPNEGTIGEKKETRKEKQEKEVLEKNNKKEDYLSLPEWNELTEHEVEKVTTYLKTRKQQHKSAVKTTERSVKQILRDFLVLKSKGIPVDFIFSLTNRNGDVWQNISPDAVLSKFNSNNLISKNHGNNTTQRATSVQGSSGNVTVQNTKQSFTMFTEEDRARIPTTDQQKANITEENRDYIERMRKKIAEQQHNSSQQQSVKVGSQ